MAHRATPIVLLMLLASLTTARAEDEGLPLPKSHPSASATPEHGAVVVLGYYKTKDLPAIVDAAKAAHLGRTVPVYVGSYGISSQDSAVVHAKLALGRYAPLFSLVRNDVVWNHRPAVACLHSGSTSTGFVGALSGGPGGHAALGPQDFEGPVPEPKALAQLSDQDRFRWGVEVGRRFRDEIRQARKRGVKIETWQFDEISPSASDPVKGPRVRLFSRAVLLGLYLGRKRLGDEPLPGLAYISNTAFSLGARALDPEMRHFWETIDQTCFRLVGEEYPTFVGDPAVQAKHEARLQHGLEKLGGPAARVAAKYVAGCSPGYLLGVSLGGNVGHWDRAQVNAWRRAYLAARVRDGATGVGEFDFLRENESNAVYADTLAAVAAALGVK